MVTMYALEVTLCYLIFAIGKNICQDYQMCLPANRDRQLKLYNGIVIHESNAALEVAKIALNEAGVLQTSSKWFRWCTHMRDKLPM